jgi:hypothetical protein
MEGFLEFIFFLFFRIFAILLLLHPEMDLLGSFVVKAEHSSRYSLHSESMY